VYILEEDKTKMELESGWWGRGGRLY